MAIEDGISRVKNTMKKSKDSRLTGTLVVKSEETHTADTNTESRLRGTLVGESANEEVLSGKYDSTLKGDLIESAKAESGELEEVTKEGFIKRFEAGEILESKDWRFKLKEVNKRSDYHCYMQPTANPVDDIEKTPGSQNFSPEKLFKFLEEGRVEFVESK